ncbi:Lipoyl synthase [anaerobic digester metagenome]
MKEKIPLELISRYNAESIVKMDKIFDNLSFSNIDQKATCLNLGEYYKKKTAAFKIMGNTCTRNCRFCAVFKGKVSPLDSAEPESVAIAAKELGLEHIVITSVTRDDLEDGGASHFAKTINAVKNILPESTVEAIIPDFQGKHKDLDKIILANPDVINHNLETVSSLFPSVKPEAQYFRSLILLKYIKEADPEIMSKTGIMLGLGERDIEVYKVMDHLAEIKCDILALSQYFQPSKKNIRVKEYISEKKFDIYKNIAKSKGIKFVASSTQFESSYYTIDPVEKTRKDWVV